MRLPNGYGSVVKQSGKRRKPYVVRKSEIKEFCIIEEDPKTLGIASSSRFSARYGGWAIECTPENKKVLKSHSVPYRTEFKQAFRDVGYFETSKEAYTYLALLNNGNIPDDQKRYTNVPTFSEVFYKWHEWRDSFKPLFDQENEKVIQPAIHPTDGPLLMGEVANVVAEVTKGDAIVVTDVGQNQMFSCRYSKFNRKRSIVTSGGLGTMGFGLPAAVGATFGAPDRMVCLFTGDGGFQMSIQELGTIMEQQAPVKVVLLNNNYLGNVRQWQDMFFNHRKSFTKMLNPHYATICKGYAIPYDVVTEREALRGAVEKMAAATGPYVLEVAIKEEDNVLPMTPPGNSVDEMLLELDLNN